MIMKTTAKVAMICTILAVSACGTGPGTLGHESANDDVAYHDPSVTMPDYSARGMSGLIATGIG